MLTKSFIPIQTNAPIKQSPDRYCPDVKAQIIVQSC